MKNESEIYELYLKKIRFFAASDMSIVYHQIQILQEVLDIDDEETNKLIENEISFLNRELERNEKGIKSYMDDTVTCDYSSLKQRKTIIKTFSKKCNGNYKLLATDYLESEELSKGIILRYVPCNDEKAVLTHNIV